MRILILYFLLMPFLANAQSLMQRKNTQKSIFLLKNDSLLPIKTLDKHKIGIILDPKQDLTVFLEFLQKYTRIEIANQENYQKYNFLIICDAQFLKQKKSQKWLYCQFSKQKIARKNHLADAVLLSNSDKLSQEIAAQLVFGGMAANGKLAKKQRKYPKNFGLTTHENGRFGYTVPQEVGMDSTKLYSKIDSLAKLMLDSQVTAGFQLLIARNGKVVFEKSYGFHTYNKTQKVQNDHLYDLASITKIATGLPLAMRLYEEKKLDLDAPISLYLPYLKGSNKDSLTFRNILTHQAGLKAWIPFWKIALEKYKSNKDVFSNKLTTKHTLQVSDTVFLDKNFYDSVFHFIRESELNGTGYRYSDLGLYLLMQAVKNLQNGEFESVLYNDFFRKIGANSLVYNPLKYFDKTKIVATEIDTVFRKRLVWGYVHDEGAALLGGISGHAGLFGNATDLAKLMQLYLNGGNYGGEVFLSKNTLDEFRRYQFYPKNRRALGFDKAPVVWDKESYISNYASSESFGHSGFTGTFTWADPKTGLLLVMLSNRVHPYRSQQNLYRLNIRPALHSVLYEVLLD